MPSPTQRNSSRPHNCLPTMIERIHRTYTTFDPQLWVLFVGTLINAIGFSLIFPFLTIYLTERLGLSLTTVGGLITLNAASGTVAQAIGGSLADQLGRKVMMATSMLASSLVIAGMGFAHALPIVLGLVLAHGFVEPLFLPASQAMIADLVEPARRTDAYGLLRVANNLGVVLGPSIGGFIAARSYLALFLAAAASSFLFFLILVALTRETKPERPTVLVDGNSSSQEEGYRQVLRDRVFLAFCFAAGLTVVVYSQMWTVFPVYLKTEFGIPENRYGLLMAMNATLVVTTQFAVTRVTNRFPRPKVMAAGALLYTLGVGTVGWSQTYLHFALNVAVVTLGEMVLIPTSAAFAADLAPAHLRGRYMGIRALANGVGFGIGPLLGGLLTDSLGATRAWPPMLGLGLIAVVGFLGLERTGHRGTV